MNKTKESQLIPLGYVGLGKHADDCVINKNEIGTLKKGAVKIIEKYIDQKIPDTKKNYDPNEILSVSGFHDVSERLFPTEETLSREEALSSQKRA